MNSQSRRLETLREWWRAHYKVILTIAVVLMTVATVVWLSYQFYRLLWQPRQIGFYKVHPGAGDLKMRYREVRRWFVGASVYERFKGALYPPASYIMLWPFLGWLPRQYIALFWAMTTVVMLGWLVWLVVRESGAETPLERMFVALIPLSAYATGATIGNGQLIVHMLPVMLASLLLLRRKDIHWGTDLLVMLLFVFSLTKPHVSAPFFWIVFFFPKRLRPAALIVSMYLLLTFLASLFRPVGAVQLVYNWLGHVSPAASTAGVEWSNYNVQSGLSLLGWGSSSLQVSLLILLLMGIWVYLYRKSDMWLLLGVIGFGTHFFTYHLWYDDLVIVPAMIALFRIAKRGRSPYGSDIVAGLLLACTICVMIAPGGQYLLPPSWKIWYMRLQSSIWIAGLVFLGLYTHWERHWENSARC